MKILKKNFFLILFITLVFLVTACSKGSNKEENKKLTGQEIIQKTIENFRNVSSFEKITTGAGYSTLKDNPSPASSDYTIEASFIKEPLTYKLIDKSGELTSNYYFKDGIEYSNKSQNNSSEWEEKTDSVKSQSYFYNTFHLRNIAKYNKDITLTEDETTYTLEFKPQNLDEFKHIYYESASPSVIEKSTLEFYAVKVTINKNDFLPLKEEIEFKKIEYAEDSEVLSNSYYKENIEYKNYNSVSSIELPADVKKIH